MFYEDNGDVVIQITYSTESGVSPLQELPTCQVDFMACAYGCFIARLAYKPAACWLCSLQCLVMDTPELGLAPFAVAVRDHQNAPLFLPSPPPSLSLKSRVFYCLQRRTSVIISCYHLIRTFDLVSGRKYS